MAEAFRSLRTSLYLAGRSTGRKIVLFTSTLAGEGKTFCSTNYADRAGAAGVADAADRRGPAFPNGRDGAARRQKLAGLADVLSRKMEADATIHATDIENLSVMPAGELQTNPAELLARADMGEIIRRIGREI